MFMVVFGVDEDTESGGPLLREVHLIISGDYVVSIHRRPFPALADLRRRYDDQPIRSEQFLVYKVLDALVSTFVPVLSRTDDDIDDVEQQVIDNPTQEELQRIFALKRDLVAMRRVVSPMRDMFARNADRIAELPGLETDDRLYFRDLYDTLIRVSELVDSYRDLLSGATDMYLSTVANRQGEVNKQLTIIATVFLPLTFLTGFFGQNFAFLTGHIINHNWTFWVFGIGCSWPRRSARHPGRITSTRHRAPGALRILAQRAARCDRVLNRAFEVESLHRFHRLGQPVLIMIELEARRDPPVRSGASAT